MREVLGMQKRMFSLVAVLLLGFAVVPANAAPIISNISGVWSNPVGGNIQSPTGLATIWWGGNSDAAFSGYQFAALGGTLSPAVGTPFILGQFTHFNRPITANTAITAVDLLFGFDTNGTPASIAATFNFGHNETPNSPPPGDDIVTITTPIVNAVFNDGTTNYFFNLLGFYRGGIYTTTFSSPEGGSNSADLYGEFREVPTDPVPEPATLLLFGSGLLIAARRRMRR